MPNYPLLKPIQWLVRTLTEFSVIHPENLPKTGGALITTNHLSRLDTPLLLAITDRTDLVGIIAKSYLEKPIIKWILQKAGRMVWMDRSTTDFTAIRDALTLLREGAIVGIAPEGTRSHETKGLLQGKAGAVLMADRAGVPLVPVAILGSDKIYQGWMKLRRPPVTVTVGEPYHLPVVDFEDRQTWLTRSTDEIMCRIAALLPPEYRGYYKDHPRLKELLQQSS
jgi:1-acyl-sn-glycerol-3-phosphate acyltransferase